VDSFHFLSLFIYAFFTVDYFFSFSLRSPVQEFPGASLTSLDLGPCDYAVVFIAALAAHDMVSTAGPASRLLPVVFTFHKSIYAAIFFDRDINELAP
jgi:hypothetical protein